MTGSGMSSPTSLPDEIALLERLRAGDDDAYETLVRDHAGRLLAVARRMLRDEEEAQDAVQEAFLSAFKAIDGFSGQSRLSTWLHRIVVNAALMRLRRRRRLGEVSIEPLLPTFDEDGHRRGVRPPFALPEEAARRRELGETLLRHVHELPADYRDVVLLRDIEHLDTREAATALGVSEAAVKTRLHRARLALRAMLEGAIS